VNSFDALRDAILRGMAHALSNRVAALGGIGSLVDPGQIWTERLSKALDDERRRLEDILRLMRLLPDDGRGEPGAVELQPLIPDVIALHAYNSALLQVVCTAAHDRETMPVFANRPRLVHLLLLAIDAAKRFAQARGGKVAVAYSGATESVTIRIATEPGVPSSATAAAPVIDIATSAAAAESALRAAAARPGAQCDVAVASAGDQLSIEIIVPTLAAGRRGERATTARPPA
jgi:hypothetical protein